MNVLYQIHTYTYICSIFSQRENELRHLQDFEQVRGKPLLSDSRKTNLKEATVWIHPFQSTSYKDKTFYFQFYQQLLNEGRSQNLLLLVFILAPKTKPQKHERQF